MIKAKFLLSFYVALSVATAAMEGIPLTVEGEDTHSIVRCVKFFSSGTLPLSMILIKGVQRLMM